MASIGLDEAAQEPSSARPSTPLNEEARPQATPVVVVCVMSPTTPQDQEDRNDSAQVDTGAETQPQPQLELAADVPVNLPSTPQNRETSIVPTTAVKLTDNLADTEAIHQPLSPTRLGLIIRIMLLHIAVALRHLMRNTALILGSQRAYYTIYEPEEPEICEQLLADPPRSAADEDVVDAIADVMMRSWREKCVWVIDKYRLEMRRDLVRDAQRRIEDAKPKVMAAIQSALEELAEQAEQQERDARALERAGEGSTGTLPDGRDHPSTPTRTPNTTADLLVIRDGVENLTIKGRLQYTPTRNDRRRLRVQPTPRSSGPTAPARFAVPDRKCHTTPRAPGTPSRLQTPRRPDCVATTPTRLPQPPGTPTRRRSQRQRNLTPSGYELSSRSGGYPVYSPVKQVESPPA